MINVSALLTQIRGDIQEYTPNVWRDADLLTWINAGVQKVFIALHGVREDWFTQRIKSTDSPITIHGVSYDPAGLRLTPNQEHYLLPPNCIEIRTLEPLSPSDKLTGIQFQPHDFSSLEFIRRIRTPISSPNVFFYDVIGVNTLKIVPTPTSTVDVELYYVAFPDFYGLADTIQILPVSATEAIKSYVHYRAYKSIAHPDTNSEFARFKEELADLKDISSPRQTQDPVIVEGVFDEDDLILI